MGRKRKIFRKEPSAPSVQPDSAYADEPFDFEASLNEVMRRNHMSSKFAPFMRHVLMVEKDEPQLCAGIISQGGFAEDALSAAIAESIQQNPNSRILVLSGDGMSYKQLVKIVGSKLERNGPFVLDLAHHMIYNGTASDDDDDDGLDDVPPEEEDEESDEEESTEEDEDDVDEDGEMKEKAVPVDPRYNQWYCRTCDMFGEGRYVQNLHKTHILQNRKTPQMKFEPQCKECGMIMTEIAPWHKKEGYILFKRLLPNTLDNTFKPTKIFIFNPGVAKKEYFKKLMDDVDCKIHSISTLNYRCRADWTAEIFESKRYKNMSKFCISYMDMIDDMNLDKSLLSRAKTIYSRIRVPRVRDTEFGCNYALISKERMDVDDDDGTEEDGYRNELDGDSDE